MDINRAREDAAGALMASKLTDTITPEDNSVLRSWLEESPSNRSLYADYAAIYSRMQAFSDTSSEDVEDALRAVYAKAWRTKSASTRAGNPSRRTRSFIGAVIATVAVIAIAVILPLTYAPKEEAPIVHTISNQDNASLHTTLPDGSNIWLRAGSTLEYDEGFGILNRNVKLTGEAYFDVTRNPGLPFYVNTGSMRLKVLGTIFNVKDFPSGVSEVVLAKGSVAMQDALGNNMLRLKPGQKASWDSVDKTFDVAEVFIGDLLLINYGVISITDASIEEIVSEIESQFGIKIIMGPSDGTGDGKLYNFNFQKGASPQSVVELLGFICKDRTFSIEDNNIQLN